MQVGYKYYVGYKWSQIFTVSAPLSLVDKFYQPFNESVILIDKDWLCGGTFYVTWVHNVLGAVMENILFPNTAKRNDLSFV